MANDVVQYHYHIVVEEWWDDDGNHHSNKTQFRMTPGEANVVNENRDVRLQNRAMKLIGSTPAAYGRR